MFSSSLFNTANSILNFQPKVLADEKLNEDKFAYQRLGDALKENLGMEVPPEQQVNQSNSVFDVDAVVDTVMQHIGKRLGEAKKSGASEDELKSMMEAAREGVEKGFGQAREAIEQAGKMDDELAVSIDEAEEGIYQGIDELEKESLSTGEKYSPSSDVSSVQYEQLYQRQKNDFSFELITQEGDKVTINAMSQSSAYAERYLEQSKDGSMAYSAYEASSSGGYDLVVEGDLSEEELEAINDLMGQVNELADEFYNGDAMSAFDMAMDLSSDPDQIAQFSLNMTSQEVKAYQYAGAMESGEASLPKGIMQPLQQFAQGVQQAAKTAELFQQPQDLLQSMFEQMEPNEAKLTSFLRPMLEQLDA